jgi:hypothetical protein
MFSVDLSTREWIIVDLAALAFIDPSGVAALARGRKHARRSPRQQTEEAGASPPHSRTAEPMAVKDGPALPSAARNVAGRDPATVVLFPGCGDDR